MEAWQLTLYGVISVIMSVLSGIAGAGGGFIMTPLSILLGLTPAQAVSSGKFNGLAVTLGSLGGLRVNRSHIRKRGIVAISLLALAVGLIVPAVIKAFESQWYQITLGVIILLLIPVMVYKKVGLKPHRPTGLQKSIGSILLAVSLFLQGVFSGGLGTLVNIVLMGFLGMSAIEANITKRLSQVVLNVVIILGVLGSGLIYWPVVFIGMITATLGGYIGGHLALKKGDEFIMTIMIGLMVLSALLLIIDGIHH
jgi:hypothetical protein